jgi:hypothetical protein
VEEWVAMSSSFSALGQYKFGRSNGVAKALALSIDHANIDRMQ